MRFDYTIYENTRGTRSNYVAVDISDQELQDLAAECDDRDEFEDKLRDWLYDCEWDNVQDFEDEVDDSEETDHSDGFYSCIYKACDRFFPEDEEEDGEVEGRRKL